MKDLTFEEAINELNKIYEADLEEKKNKGNSQKDLATKN